MCIDYVFREKNETAYYNFSDIKENLYKNKEKNWRNADL